MSSGPAENVPPTSATRSRMPAIPLPPRGSSSGTGLPPIGFEHTMCKHASFTVDAQIDQGRRSRAWSRSRALPARCDSSRTTSRACACASIPICSISTIEPQVDVDAGLAVGRDQLLESRRADSIGPRAVTATGGLGEQTDRATDLVEAAAAVARDLVEQLLGAFGIVAHRHARAVHVHHQDRQRVRQHVVHVTSDAAAFFERGELRRVRRAAHASCCKSSALRAHRPAERECELDVRLPHEPRRRDVGDELTADDDADRRGAVREARARASRRSQAREADNASNANKTGEPPVHVNTSVGTSERTTNVHDSQRCGTPGSPRNEREPDQQNLRVQRQPRAAGNERDGATIAPAKTPAPQDTPRMEYLSRRFRGHFWPARTCRPPDHRLRSPYRGTIRRSHTQDNSDDRPTRLGSRSTTDERGEDSVRSPRGRPAQRVPRPCGRVRGRRDRGCSAGMPCAAKRATSVQPSFGRTGRL